MLSSATFLHSSSVLSLLIEHFARDHLVTCKNRPRSCNVTINSVENLFSLIEIFSTFWRCGDFLVFAVPVFLRFIGLYAAALFRALLWFAYYYLLPAFVHPFYVKFHPVK